MDYNNLIGKYLVYDDGSWVKVIQTSPEVKTLHFNGEYGEEIDMYLAEAQVLTEKQFELECLLGTVYKLGEDVIYAETFDIPF